MEAAYDLIVLGGGPAGYTASERAAKAGLSTLCIERRALGGVCLNEGCVPTKTLLYSAKLFDGIRSGGRYGVTAEGAAIDHAAVLKRKDKVVKTLVAGVRAAMRESGAEVLFADAVIGGKTDSGYAVEAGGQRYIGKRLLIATGSESVVPPISGLNEALAGGFVMTSREILTPETPPERLVVIGGGVIGLELACYFCSIGTAVTVVELLDHIAGGNDPDLTVILQKNLAKKGMRFELNAKVTSIADGSITFERDGVTETIEADRALLCIGRRPVTADLGLSGIGVETARGAIVTDARMRTSADGVYAAGDVNGRSMLAHTAIREAEVAVHDMLGVPDQMHYHAIPAVVYTNPELASVGETEYTARQKGIAATAVSLSMRYSGRYLAENEGGDGMMKVVFNDADGTVIGVQMLGNHASECIAAAAAMVENGMTAEQAVRIVFAHPTVGELMHEAAVRYVGQRA